ncbi:MAG: hypothetical protein HY754_00210 [Nitrospirae bacterium]|nr:hypothetical protein [Nitrospirota bacterium]
MQYRIRGSEPQCPFCGEWFEKPHDIKAELGNVFTGGRCECGAVYVFDRSGHNLGEAYVNGLVFACDGDWETAWKLIPEVDYDTRSFYYDPGSHQIMEDAGRGGRPKENLLFIALKKKTDDTAVEQ